MAEAQLKLATIPSELSTLRMALEGAGATADPEPSFLTSTYYDSPDLQLRRQRLTFCVEEQDQRRVQSLRGDGEWRDPIDGDAPDPAAPETGPRLRAAVDAELRPLFKTEVRRTVFTVAADPAVEIAAALDEGEIHAAESGAAERLCEVELELRRGEPAALYDMALRLLDAAPVRIEPRSKSDRGYRLTGAERDAVTAKPVALEPTMTVEAVLQSAGRECLAHFLRNEPAALAGEAEALHQMRIALRRLRSILAAVRSMLPAEQYRWLRDELTWLAASLGPARDWDVFASDLIAPVKAALPEDAALQPLAAMAEARRQAAYRGAQAAIASRRYAESVLKIARWVEARGWRDQPASEHSAPLFAPIADVAPRLLERRWRQARKRSRHFAALSQDDRHRLRIALKKLRYMTEILGGLYDAGAVKAVTKRLKPLQRDLGHLNDVRTAERLMRETADGASGVGRDAGLVLGWHVRGLADREAKLRRDVRRLRKAKPFWRGAQQPAAAEDGAAPA